MIDTINGKQDEATLVKSTGVVDHPDHVDSWVEYRDVAGTLVHRSVHVTMKVGMIGGAVAGVIG